jgi:hypothetical protein
MESYEDFKARNRGWDHGYASDKEMRRNYEIACNVEKIYNDTYGHIDGPKIGDIVQVGDEWSTHTRAKIVENLYGGSEYGMLCVCDHGSSHTNGRGFSTSGGAFHAYHKSKFRFVGEDVNIVWTWGCGGAGANQGIYFPLKVRKWIIPHEPIKFASLIQISGPTAKTPRGERRLPVTIQNAHDWYNVMSFISLRAFNAWAKYVGYKHESYGKGSFQRRSPMRIEEQCVLDVKYLPEGVKPIKVLANGKMRDGWVLNDGKKIINFWLNVHEPNEPRYGTKEYEEEMKIFRKYQYNPMGV